MERFNDPIEKIIPVIKDACETNPKTKAGTYLQNIASAVALAFMLYMIFTGR